MSNSSVFERHYTPSQLAEVWNIGYDKILDLFRDEPDVVKISNEGCGRKRTYSTLRIPQSVAERVHRRLSNC